MPANNQIVYGLNGYDDEHHEGEFTFWHRLKEWTRPEVRTIAVYCPLAAAILAPLSTLLDIPALSQRWYTLDGISQPDPPASLALSAVGLFLNLLANVLLLFRFSAHTQKYTQIATRLSLLSWLGKTAVAVVNLIVFGATSRNGAGFHYEEGFWAAVVSLVVAGLISISLLFHYFGTFRKHEDVDEVDIRMQGKTFMLSIQVFLGIIALQALAFSRIEGWTYIDSIYFSVQTALTIGFGDLTPSYTSSKILVFIFTLLTTSQLGNEIAIIVRFVSARAEERRNRWRRKYERAMHREANAKKPQANLIEEMGLIWRINAKEELISQWYDLMWSGISLLVFWMVGATMFSQVEGWTFGNALYACMILSFTIGFGDYAPETPAGRVNFIWYSLLAVPIVTSFAVTTISGLLSTYSERRVKRDRYRRARRNAPDAFKPHGEYIVRANESYGEMRDRLLGQAENPDATAGESGAEKKEVQEELNTAEKRVMREWSAAEKFAKDRTESHDGSNGDEPTNGKTVHGQNDAARELELDLIKQLMDLVIKLEAESRDLLLTNMEHGIPRTLLLADRNVQIRDVRAVRGDDADILKVWRGVEGTNHPDEAISKLAKVREYRNTFAEILVIGAILQRLEGEERDQFERTQTRDREVMLERQKVELRESAEDLEDVAEQQFDGLTSKILRYHAKKMRKGIARRDEALDKEKEKEKV